MQYSLKGVSHYKYLTLKRFYIKLTRLYWETPYFPATCMKYNNFIGIPLQLDRKWF